MQCFFNTHEPRYFTASMTHPWVVAPIFQYQEEPKRMLFGSHNFLEQLQGTYTLEINEGLVYIHVLMPVKENQSLLDSSCTIVRRVSSDGDALPDQLIVEEPNRFALCSLNKSALAYIDKGSNFWNGLTWKAVENECNFFWQRVGHGTIVSPTKFNWSMSQTQQISSLESQTGNTGNVEANSGNFMPQGKQISSSGFTAMYTYPGAIKSCTQNENFIPYSGSIDSYSGYPKCSLTSNKPYNERKLFKLITATCFERPNLLKKVLNWGLTNCDDARFSVNQMRKKVSAGRVWFSCMLKKDTTVEKSNMEISPEQDALDDLKGAYREIPTGSGVWFQPCPEAIQPALQHRLRKDNHQWIIEERDPNARSWKLRANKGSGSNWVDIKNDHEPFRAIIIPMSEILETMPDCMFRDDIETKLNFLFEKCNQKKLNTKLSERNLKHTMYNLNVKLEKLDCLTFSIQLVRMADKIAKEHGIVC